MRLQRFLPWRLLCLPLLVCLVCCYVHWRGSYSALPGVLSGATSGHCSALMGLSFLLAGVAVSMFSKNSQRLSLCLRPLRHGDGVPCYSCGNCQLVDLYNDILLGMSTVSHCDFWIGSALGFLPLGVTATLVGAGAIQADISHLAQYLGIATVAFFILTLSLKWILAQRQRKSLSISQ